MNPKLHRPSSTTGSPTAWPQVLSWGGALGLGDALERVTT
jgi:hypothetical protein